MTTGEHVRDCVTGFEGVVVRVDKAGVHVREDGLNARSRGGSFYVAPPTLPQVHFYAHPASRLFVVPAMFVHPPQGRIRAVK